MEMPHLVGLTEGKAVLEIRASGLKARIVRRDKKRFTVTMDLRNDRINLEIDHGKVTRAYTG